MRGTGTLPAGGRFQVCLPTRMAVGYWFVAPSSRPDFFAACERAFGADLAKICAAVPHDDLTNTVEIAWATGAASRPRRGPFPTSASRPSAAGAAATLPALRGLLDGHRIALEGQ